MATSPDRNMDDHDLVSGPSHLRKKATAVSMGSVRWWTSALTAKRKSTSEGVSRDAFGSDVLLSYVMIDLSFVGTMKGDCG